MSQWTPVVTQRDALGESPFWHPHEDRLYWVDIPVRQVRRFHPGSGMLESWTLDQEPGCIAPARRGGLVLGLRDGIYRAPEWAGPLQLLQRFEHDPATARANDGKADPVGRFWAGTVYEPKDQPLAALYSLDARSGAPMRGLERKVDGAFTANGLAWSPAADAVYWADTPSHTVRAWRWDARTSAMSQERVLHAFAPKPPGWSAGQPGYGGRPDGAAVDAQGRYWVAMYEGGRLVCLSPQGEVLHEIATPMLCPTMPCFGGPGLRTLYLTSAGQRPESELRERPASGCVVGLEVEVPGLPVNFFID